MLVSLNTIDGLESAVKNCGFMPNKNSRKHFCVYSKIVLGLVLTAASDFQLSFWKFTVLKKANQNKHTPHKQDTTKTKQAKKELFDFL